MYITNMQFYIVNKSDSTDVIVLMKLSTCKNGNRITLLI